MSESPETKAMFHDLFLDGNELIDKAINTFRSHPNAENLNAVLESIRSRMHADGHFIIPIIETGNEDEFTPRKLKTKDGREWLVAFTSQTEHEKGAKSRIISNFIGATLKGSLETNSSGFIINPWGQSFKLSKELIERILKADGDVEYSIPDKQITPELLEGGTFLKRAIGICNRNWSPLNSIKLMKILRDSFIWIPCNTILSDADYEAMEKLVKEAQENGGLDTLIGKIISHQDNVRLVPDILQKGENFFFPVFTSAEEMGEYGMRFSRIEKHFLDAIVLARNNEKNVQGIVINAFSEPFIIPRELFEKIERMPSILTEK